LADTTETQIINNPQGDTNTHNNNISPFTTTKQNITPNYLKVLHTAQAILIFPLTMNPPTTINTHNTNNTTTPPPPILTPPYHLFNKRQKIEANKYSISTKDEQISKLTTASTLARIKSDHKANVITQLANTINQLEEQFHQAISRISSVQAAIRPTHHPLNNSLLQWRS
jgi:hypothetical protein